MRLSEAIRLGALLRPRQAFGVLYDRETDATCALGAAADAIGLLNVPFNDYKPWPRDQPERVTWRWSATALVDCPACDWEDSAQHLIIHLNTEHRWTREQIADWVETLEWAFDPIGAAGTGAIEDACSPAGDGPSPSQRGRSSVSSS